jgi:hypothetical protein
MRPLSTLSTVALLGGFHALPANAIQAISSVGSKFFYENGTQYFLKGELPWLFGFSLYINLVQIV